MKINLVGAFTNPYGNFSAEYNVQNALLELCHDVKCFDYRQNETEAACGISADLTLVLKGDGISPEVIKKMPRPTALWYGELIHQRPEIADEVSIQKAKELACNVNAFGFVFHHDYTALETIKFLGARRVFWVPNSGVNLKCHRRLETPKLYDVGFAGTPSPRRISILNALKSVGIEVVYKQVFGEEYNLFINQCKIFLNMHFTELLNTETRLHEILGAGTFALSEEISMPDMYEDGNHLVYWRRGDIDDLVSKINYYLTHKEERQAIALKEHRMVHERYKYVDRCKEGDVLNFL